MIKFIPLGGADEIGASCYYLNIFGTGIILDSGIHPRKTGKKSIPDFGIIKNEPLDFVFISHAHQDHVGSLPYLIKKYPHAKVYATSQTIQIADATLHNAVRILSNQLTEEDDLEIYTHNEIDLLIKFIVDKPCNETFNLRGLKHSIDEDVKVTFYDAGHILGSVSILIEIDDLRIFYTGDINITSQSIMDGADLPKKNIDILITESTYGATESEKLGTWHSESRRFAKEANKIIANGGSVLIPIFSLGKTQEILSTINHLIQKGLLIDTYIYTGGIGKEISRIYDKNRYLVKRKNKNFELSEIEQINYLDITDYHHYQRKPGFVLASSGMMINKTTSYKLAKYWLPRGNFGIFIVGYIDPEAPGYRIKSAKKGGSIDFYNNGREIKINCEIKKFYFPSHSKREDLLKIEQKLNPKKVILVHGESKGFDWLGHNILKTHPHVKLFAAKTGNWIELK